MNDRQQVVDKLRALGGSPALKNYVAKLNSLETVMKKETLQIYEAAFKSAVPIRGHITKSRATGEVRVRLTLKQKDDLVNLARSGATIDQIVKKLTNPKDIIETNFYGGTLRKSITTNIGRVSSGQPGYVFIPDGFHNPPYKRDSKEWTLEGLALELNDGIYKKKTGSGNYLRSRPSEAEGGFTPLSGQTKDWIRNARIAAEPLVEDYVTSAAKNLLEFSGGYSPSAKRISALITNNEPVPSLQLSFLLKKTITGAANTEINRGIETSGTSASDLFEGTG